jgi:peptidoglycan/LPS O-acetylase OafA/YrhL
VSINFASHVPWLAHQQESTSQSRSSSLDFLRTIAVLLVLLRHLPSVPETTVVGAIFNGVAQTGWIGVDLFFVLSGYLVSGLILKELHKTGSFNVQRFLIRRALKIYPAFYCMILISAGIFLIKPGYVRWQGLLAEALFVQNYFGGLWNHTWSLAVEEHFYILLVAIVWVAVRIKIRPVHALCLCSAALIVACTTLRLSILESPYHHETHLFPTHLRMDALVFGVLLRVFLNKNIAILSNLWVRVSLIFFACAASSWSFLYPLGSAPWITGIGLTILSISSAVLIAALSNWPAFESNIVIKLGARLGSHSYSIYLWHMLLMHVFNSVVKRVFPDALPLLANSVCILWMLVGGVVLSKLIELPVLKFRDRIFPSLSVPAT